MGAVRVRPVREAEARRALEMIKFGGGLAQPVVRWDGEPVGDGAVGPVARALGELIAADMSGDGDGAATQLDDVPYDAYL